MIKREITKNSKLTVYSINDADPQVVQLLEEAQTAAQRAYCPYSNFQVGAALRLSNGQIVQGNNQENAAYPSGLCAERVAFFAAKSLHPEEEIEMVAIVAKPKTAKSFKLATPCGSCRQVMSEYENQQTKPIRLFLLNEKNEVYESESIDNILPFKFSDKHLKE
ncbi:MULTISPECIES: cytidine deaminase [Roseivirga]|jgi:cytidine deaminase|uniref:cytidine deaminase n=1 Tax=Roseivirga TaxID=290180 RepID=UPI00257C16B6|nr:MULTISPECIES: cytidine deaminase [Roseivirga]|tara:strand:- start:797 stop:1288 length:492 start_codon:yes stop_codon:yes gene_type:complete